MLYRLIDDLNLSGQDLDALVAKARYEASRLLPSSCAADEDIAALRALLNGDVARLHKVREAPGRAGTKRTWVAVLMEAFVKAVSMRFGADAAREEDAASRSCPTPGSMTSRSRHSSLSRAAEQASGSPQAATLA